MNRTETTTCQNILDAGRKEFLAKGFRAASLRNMVKEAGVTTGAFYGYYKSKEELFDALVEEPAAVFLESFKESQAEFEELTPEEQQKQMGKKSGDCLELITMYVYEHLEAFRLILCCAEGTKYENFVHNLVQIETSATNRFLTTLQDTGIQVRNIDPQLEHILISGFFSAFFEMVIHGMSQEQACGYVNALRDFYNAGWKEMLGL